ncbi:uncharacterized protein si:ch211-106e7.2 isoform X2 [Syngnathoides biaculeatus]|uniref:uncharacterized protein si:ch211-106e7.2 isoform X2 n=1 Tax=Syngnathoides biaculeatus TaxID=300417 RepID=UPI002ADD975F|nr:uncharacterized protein si:ch211-106e7.2 isoform X2 [Syngnathoides biaculeatus]
MYLGWLNFGSSSQHWVQFNQNAVDPGVKKQQSAISYQNGLLNGLTPLWESAHVSHQTPGGKHVGYKRTFVDIHNPSCNPQGGNPFHGDGFQNALNNSSLHSGSDHMSKTMCYQDNMREHRFQYRPTPPTSDSNMFSLPLQHRGNEDLHQVSNKVPSQPKIVPFQPTTPLQVIQGVASSSLNNTGISVNTTKYGLYPSAHTGSASFNLKNFVVRPPSTGQILPISTLNQPTKQISSIVFDGSKKTSPTAAEMRHNVIGTLVQGSTCQQTTTQPSEQQFTTESKVAHLKKTLPLLSQLILGPGSVNNSTQSLSNNKLNDSSSSARVVAVVQPLSPHCNTTTCASKSPKTLNFNFPIVDTQNKSKHEDCWNSLEREIQPPSNKSLSVHMSATGEADDTPCERLSVHTSAPKQSHDMPSKGHCIGAGAPQQVDSGAPKEDKEASNKDATPQNAKDSSVKLSFLPTTKWTLKELALLRLGLESQDSPRSADLRKQLLVMFWGGSVTNLVSVLKTKSHLVLVNRVQSFCANNVREDTPVLSQVDSSFADQLENFHILKDGEVYTELPYTSSWLNKNEQLDDIDKEFGPNTYSNVSDNQPGPVKRVTNIPSQPVCEVPRLDLETVENECNDPLYIFKIEILPPEDAKAIFEQGHVVMSQTKQSVNPPEEVTNPFDGVVDEPVQELQVPSASKADSPIQHFCCIAKWKETIFGSKTPLQDKCLCKEELCNPMKKQDQMNCEQFTMEPDHQSHSPEEDMESKSEEKMTSSLPTIDWLEICNEISETFELNDDDDEETSDLDEEQPNESQPTTVSISKENISNCETITKHVPDNEEGCNKAQLKFAQSCQSSESHIISDDWRTENKIESPISLIDEHGKKAPVAAKSPLENEKIQRRANPRDQTDASTTKAPETNERKRKRLNANSVFPYLKKLMNKNLNSHEIKEVSKTKIAQKRTVQLKLFGSLSQEKGDLMNHCIESTPPPKVVCATVDKTNPPKSCSNSVSSTTKRTLSQSKTKLGAKMKAIRDRKKKRGSQNHKEIIGNQPRKSFKQHRKKNETGTPSDLPIQENVLKFTVLPNSFSFEDESTSEKESTENSSVDVWSHFPVKELSSVDLVPVSKSSDVFAEFQKKYKEKSQASVKQ